MISQKIKPSITITVRTTSSTSIIVNSKIDMWIFLNFPLQTCRGNLCIQLQDTKWRLVFLQNVDSIQPSYIPSHPGDSILHSDESLIAIKARHFFTNKVWPHITMPIRWCYQDSPGPNPSAITSPPIRGLESSPPTNDSAVITPDCMPSDWSTSTSLT